MRPTVSKPNAPMRSSFAARKISASIGRRKLIAIAIAACTAVGPRIGTAQAPVQPASFTGGTNMLHPGNQKPFEAVSFVMTNEVFTSDRKPIKRHEIVFDSGRAYDFPGGEDRFVSVFDMITGEVTLLDRAEKTKAVISGDTLVRVAIQAQAMLAEQDNAAELGVLADVEVSDDRAIVRASYGDTTYEVMTTSVDDPKTAEAYSKFVETFSRLNLVRGLGGPPFARIRIYEQIRLLGRLPVETSLVRRSEQATQTVRGTHRRGPLSGEHKRRINEAAGMMTLYKSIELDAFGK